MNSLRLFSAVLYLGLLLDLPAFATNLVTGNGFGFVVVSPQTASVTKFYAHPYSFVRPDPQNPLSEGIETGNFLRSIGWGDSAVHNSTADYEEDSHVIHVRNGAGEGFFFMPFGFLHPALIVSWQLRSDDRSVEGLSSEWTHAIKSQKTVPTAGYR